MQDVPAFPAEVNEAGLLVISKTQRQEMARWCRTLKGEQVDVIVQKRTRKRSHAQNAWHWGVAVPKITAAADMDPNDAKDCELVHYGLVAKCFGTTVHEQLGPLPNARSSKLTTQQFSYLMEWEVRFAADEYGLYVPMPDDVREWVEQHRGPAKQVAGVEASVTSGAG
jgi:hypothetical protein